MDGTSSFSRYICIIIIYSGLGNSLATQGMQIKNSENHPKVNYSQWTGSSYLNQNSTQFLIYYFNTGPSSLEHFQIAISNWAGQWDILLRVKDLIKQNMGTN